MQLTYRLKGILKSKGFIDPKTEKSNFHLPIELLEIVLGACKHTYIDGKQYFEYNDIIQAFGDLGIVNIGFDTNEVDYVLIDDIESCLFDNGINPDVLVDDDYTKIYIHTASSNEQKVKELMTEKLKGRIAYIDVEKNTEDSAGLSHECSDVVFKIVHPMPA